MIKVKTIIVSLCLLFPYEISTMAQKKPLTLVVILQCIVEAITNAPWTSTFHQHQKLTNIDFLHVLPLFPIQYFTLMNNPITMMNLLIWRGLNNWFIRVLILIIWKNEFDWYNLKKEDNIWPGLKLVPPVGYSSNITKQSFFS